MSENAHVAQHFRDLAATFETQARQDERLATHDAQEGRPDGFYRGMAEGRRRCARHLVGQARVLEAMERSERVLRRVK